MAWKERHTDTQTYTRTVTSIDFGQRDPFITENLLF